MDRQAYIRPPEIITTGVIRFTPTLSLIYIAKSVLTHCFGIKIHFTDLGFTLLQVMGRQAYMCPPEIITTGVIKLIPLSRGSANQQPVLCTYIQQNIGSNSKNQKYNN